MTDRLLDLAAAAVECVQKASASNRVQQSSAVAQAVSTIHTSSSLLPAMAAAQVLKHSPWEVFGIQLDPSLASGMLQSVDVDLFTNPASACCAVPAASGPTLNT